MTWFGEHLGCYIACVPRGCQGEVSNAGCEAPAPRLCWNWALLGKLGPSQNTRHFGERGRDGDGGGSWVSPKCLLVITVTSPWWGFLVSAERGEESRNIFSPIDFFKHEAFLPYQLITFRGLLHFFSPESCIFSLKELIFYE